MKISNLAVCFLAGSFIAEPVSAFQRELPGAATLLADEIAVGGKHQLAVVDFTDLQGNVTELGRFIAEEMALGLVTSKKQIAVIDRTHLRALLQEHKLASSGVIDPATARRLGEIAGVDALVTGTITALGDSVRLVVKVLDTNTARILTASSVDVAKTKTIEELMARDIRGDSYALPQSALAPPSITLGRSPQAPTYQNDALRVTAGEVGVTANNGAGSLSVTIENISRDPIFLAVQARDSGYATASLSDDRGTEWRLLSFSGLEVLPPRPNSKYSEAIRASDNFTLISPGGRSAIVMHFDNGCGVCGSPAGLFSFSAQGVRYAASGVSRFSIGLTGIKGTVINK